MLQGSHLRETDTRPPRHRGRERQLLAHLYLQKAYDLFVRIPWQYYYLNYSDYCPQRYITMSHVM